MQQGFRQIPEPLKGFCEDYILGNTNCEIVKVRDNGEVGIIEVDNIGEILRDGKYNEINDALKGQGFRKVALNLSQIDDNEDIVLDYEMGSFSYRLPFTINLENTMSEIKSKIINETKNKIELENIAISQNGLVEGNDFKTYEDALNAFMNILPKLRRNIGE